MGDSSLPTGKEPVRLNRRRLLQAAGAAGVGSIAGCIGGDQDSGNGNSSSDSTPSDDADFVDQPFVSVETLAIDQMHFNSYNQDNFAYSPGYLVFDELIYYQADVSEYQPGIVTDWEITDDLVTLTVREGVPWHGGEEVTAEDVARKLKLGVYDGGTMGRFTSAESIEATDEYTVEVGLEVPVSEEIFLSSLKGDSMDVPEDPYQEILEDFEDGGDGVTSNGEGLADLTIDEPNGTGPFKYADRNEQELVLERTEEHPDAENINFPEYRFRYFENNQAQWQALQTGEVDGVAILHVPPEIHDGFPDEVKEYQITPNWGAGVIFDHEHKHFGQREVRQAIAHVIDREDVATSSGPRTKAPVDIPTGIPGNFEVDDEIPANDWLGDRVDEYETYEGQNTDRAADLLESAGFQKDGGTWHDSDGNPLQFPIKAPGGWTDYVDACQVMVQHLSDFGIEAEFVARDEAAFFGEDVYGDGFDVAMFQWTTAQAYPYFNFEFMLDSPDQTDVFKYPDEIELPPVGEPDGAEEPFVSADELEDLLTVETGSDEEAELVQRLAWAVNYDLPVLPIQETVDQSFVRTDNWDVVGPDDSDAQVDWPMTYLPRVGKLTAKSE
ncbi:ABC transporter substrate-binding protein [Natronosalvus rutilus]|uniref:ABC transporter substrate-binding protein n=1 Tax=Natronosalvus rutilus TaxID=2953753 RepID=A0A9E7N8E2_9EURY|nr:ABC transporter substrate-binding protein [Natronosalvus rutilus]UTF52233.1 ABC transporter substrate-binding protein [Natronosalvus rutilus]